MFSFTLLYVHSSFAALLSLPSWCLVIVVWLCLAVPWVCLQFVMWYFLIILTYYSCEKFVLEELYGRQGRVHMHDFELARYML